MSAGLTADSITHEVPEGTGRKATLAPFSAQFEPCRLHVVNGPSGAGKTTLLTLLALTVPPTSGAIFWNGQQMTGRSDEENTKWRRRHVGLLFQHSRLLSLMTVREHIALAANIRSKPSAYVDGLVLLDTLGLSDKLELLPAQLSGGEKQRVSLAQALCAGPAIVLADEPTAALDEVNSATVADTLRSYAQKRSAIVVCVTHDSVVNAQADATIALSKP